MEEPKVKHESVGQKCCECNYHSDFGGGKCCVNHGLSHRQGELPACVDYFTPKIT